MFAHIALALLTMITTGQTVATQTTIGTVTSANMPTASDYAFLWWPYGWRGRSAEGRRVLCVQTGRYGMALDVEKVKLLNFGAIQSKADYREAVSQSNDVVFRLPQAEFDLSVQVGSDTFHCVRGAVNQADTTNFPVRMIECGRFMQHFDILQLQFENARGERLDADARLEVFAWPDRLTFLLELTPKHDLHNTSLAVACSAVKGMVCEHSPMAAQDLKAGEVYTKWLALSPAPGPHAPAHDIPPSVSTVDGSGHLEVLPIALDEAHGWFRVALKQESWQEGIDLDHLERQRLYLSNASGKPSTVRLLFAKDYPFAGVTGMTPMLRDAAGNPTGIPVQLSKDWHQTAGRHFPNEGPWFHGFSVVHLQPHQTLNLEFALTYGRWGGVPAASHAQLCLVGYSTNQLWDQAALGSWGESITYDPDVNLGRSMIDDVRPLMVTQMNSKDGKWAWTNNVGGGDFLAYLDADGHKQFLTRMKTAYLSQGPNLTDVIYSGISADGKIAANIEVSTPRSDDINRELHRFRYDVLKPTPFSRLAFYQVGSDGYNDNQFELMARGNERGLTEEWKITKGGKRYARTGMVCDGEAPWFSMHRAVNTDKLGGAWANRGLVIRGWKARLGGQTVSRPFASCYGTENGVPGMNVEIAPPPDLKMLLPGDFVEADVEFVVMPQHAQDYYGPNENLRKALMRGGDTWQPIYREAAHNLLKVTVLKGSLMSAHPVRVHADSHDVAELEIAGGVGYAPLTFVGLTRYRGYSLWLTEGGITKRVDQSVHGNDFWQTDFDAVHHTWSLTFNVPLDSPTDSPRTRRYALRSR